MSDWLQGNIARSQNTLQAIDAKGKIRQRADDRMSKLGDTISKYTLPKMQQQLDIEKEEKLWGEGGVRNQLQKDILDIQHKNTLTEQSTLNSLQADREKKFATHKSEITDKLWNERTGNAPKRNDDGSFTNEYLIHAYGIDRWWQEQQISMRNRDANKDLYRSVHEWFSQNSKDWVANWGDAFEIDPATGEVTRLKAEREEELINYLVTAYDNDRLQKKSVPNGTDGDGKTIWRQLTGEEMRPIFQQYSETFPWEEMGAGTETGDSVLTQSTQTKLKNTRFPIDKKMPQDVKNLAYGLELLFSASRNALETEEQAQELLNRADIYRNVLKNNYDHDVALRGALTDYINEVSTYVNENMNERARKLKESGQSPFKELTAIPGSEILTEPEKPGGGEAFWQPFKAFQWGQLQDAYKKQTRITGGQEAIQSVTGEPIYDTSTPSQIRSAKDAERESQKIIEAENLKNETEEAFITKKLADLRAIRNLGFEESAEVRAYRMDLARKLAEIQSEEN
jgi:hypothetical protein